MAIIDKLYKSMGLPMNIKRGNPWPLDASSVWYSYDEMKAYAEDATGVAYVGQILALVDETNNSAEAYIITDKNGTLKAIGSGVLTDNKTIMVNKESGEIGLKDFGKRFYKFIPAEKNEETGEIIKEFSYELTEVNEENPWVTGLEPRVVLEDGQLVLGWFEQNTTTIDGVNAQISSIQTSISDLQKSTKDLSDAISDLDEKKANVADVFTKAETTAQINQAISAANHLKRKIVNSYVDITTFIAEHGALEAAKYIFMVPESDLTADGNIYEEYLVIDGVIEVIGKWSTDLTDYVSKTELNDSLEWYVKKNDLNQSLNNYVSFSSLNEELKNYTKTEELNNLLDEKVDKEDGHRLISLEEVEKLNRLFENAGNSFIKSVSEDFFISAEGKLSLNTNEGSLFAELNKELTNQKDSLDNLITKVSENEIILQGLNTTVEKVVLKYENVEEAIKGLNTTVTETKQAVENNKTLINSLNESLRDYVTVQSYNADISKIYKHLTWSSIED